MNDYDINPVDDETLAAAQQETIRQVTDALLFGTDWARHADDSFCQRCAKRGEIGLCVRCSAQ